MTIIFIDFISIFAYCQIDFWPRSTMDSIRASEAPDAGSIPAEATKFVIRFLFSTRGLNSSTFIIH
jgi:hypothetical protein